MTDHPTTPRRLLAPLLLAALAVAALGVGLARRAEGAAQAAPSGKAGIVVIETRLGLQGGAAAGTGMILTSSGEVLTNNHVIQGATSIRVVVPQTGRRYSAKVLGYDVSADTALLKLNGASGLATVSTGDSSKLARGQAVRAVGNAGGTGTLTTARGKITGLGRTITVSNDEGVTQRLGGLIETSAALQPGDSGGPLLDSSTRVIGMDTAVSTAGGGFFFKTPTNDAYAIPIDAALGVVRQIESGHATAAVHIGATAFLGVQLGSPDQGGFGEEPGGALVAGVVSGSPADRAGLVYGDEITSVDHRAVASPKTIVAAVLQKKPGSKISLAWTSVDGATHTSTVTLGSGPPQ